MGTASPLSSPNNRLFTFNSISLVEADHIRTSLRAPFKTLFHVQLFVWIPALREPREKRESSTFFLHNFRLVPDNSCVINGLTLVRRHTVRGGGGGARFCPTQWIIISTSGHIFSAAPDLVFPREQQWCCYRSQVYGLKWAGTMLLCFYDFLYKSLAPSVATLSFWFQVFCFFFSFGKKH